MAKFYLNRNFSQVLSVFLVCLVAAVVALWAIRGTRAADTFTYYVRTDGADTNDGLSNSAEGAFKTITKAAEIVNVGDTVLVQAGTYDEQVTLSKSGTESSRITFEGVGAVIIEGGTRVNAVVISGAYNTFKNIEVQHGQTGISVQNANVTIDGCHIHNTSSSYYGAISGDSATIVTNSEINNNVRVAFFEKWAAVSNCNIHDNTGGLSYRQLSSSPRIEIKNNIFTDNQWTFSIYSGDQNKDVLFEGNEFNGGGGFEFSNGKITLIDNSFHDINGPVINLAYYGTPSATDAFIDHNLFDSCNPVLAMYNGITTMFSDDNVFTSDTVISNWQSPEAAAGSWTSAEVGTLPDWQTNSGQDSNSVIGTSLSDTTKSTAYVTSWTVSPILDSNGLNIKFSGTMASRETFTAKLQFSVTDESNNVYTATVNNFNLTAEESSNFDQNVIIPQITGQVLCKLDILDGTDTRVGGKFKYLTSPSAVEVDWLNPSYRASIFTRQTDKEVRVKVTITSENINLSTWSVHAGIRLKNEVDWQQENIFTAAAELTVNLPGGGLAIGSYELVTTLLDDSSVKIDETIMDLTVLAQADNEVRIDENGTILINEEPFFPISIDGDTNQISDFLSFADAGFNVANLYRWNGDNNFWNAIDQTDLKILYIGIVANLLTESQYTTEQKLEFLNSAADTINSLKNHTSFLGYLWGEELVWKNELVSLYQQNAVLDPYHPVAMNGSFSGANSLYYIADIMMNHLYPYPKYSDNAAQVAAKIGNIGDISDANIAVSNGEDIDASFPGLHLAVGKKPWWIWPQYFYGGNWVSGGGGRFLTLTEMRDYIWTEIARGAKGVHFWAYFHDYTNPRMNPKLWESVRAIAGEVRSLEKVLVQTDAANVVSADSTTDLSMKVKEYQGNKYIFATYNGSTAKKIKFYFSSAQSGNIAVWSENRTLSIADNAFEDDFEPTSVHIYTTAAADNNVKMKSLLADSYFADRLSYQAKAGNFASKQSGATASSSNYYCGLNHGTYAIDSDPDTNWFPLYDGSIIPSFTNPTGNNPEWLQVNFANGATKNINQIVVRSYKPKYYADANDVLADFDLQYWDGSDWQLIESVTGNDDENLTLDFPYVSTNKIRLVAKYGLYVSEIEAYHVNYTPTLDNIGNKNIVVGENLSFNVSGSDPEDDTLIYSASNLPEGATFDALTHSFSWAPTDSQVGTYTTVRFTVSDGTASASEDITITVYENVAEALAGNDDAEIDLFESRSVESTTEKINLAPILSAIGNKRVMEQTRLSFTVFASDPEGDTLTFLASNLPHGARFDTDNHSFYWTPSANQVGEYGAVTFTVSDGRKSVSESINITVEPKSIVSEVISGISKIFSPQSNNNGSAQGSNNGWIVFAIAALPITGALVTGTIYLRRLIMR